jgi:hypothetical protein
MRVQKQSSHVIYTEYYDYENYIFKYGDLINSVAAAAAIDRLWLKRLVVSSDIWRKDLAERWKDWIKLCLFAKLKKIRGGVNYRLTSQINTPLYANVDMTLFNQRLADLKRSSGLSNTQFKRAYARISRYVDGLYRVDEYEQVFKGKWYAPLIESDIRNLAGTIPIESNSLASRLISVLSATLDFQQDWAEYFKQRIRDLLVKI